MSPEQARGKRVDKRTDIWAFGCVLFEMLTGKRAFAGETTSDVIAAIIERAPDLSALPASTPPHIRRVIERCLEKDPKRRARDIADVRAALDGVVGVGAERVRDRSKCAVADRRRTSRDRAGRLRRHAVAGPARRRPRRRQSNSRLVRLTGID